MPRGASIISHLLFVDDSYLLFRANTQECLHLKNRLLQFEKASGHKINKDENIDILTIYHILEATENR